MTINMKDFPGFKPSEVFEGRCQHGKYGGIYDKYGCSVCMTPFPNIPLNKDEDVSS